MQDGLTALMLATYNGYLKVVEALLDAMSDPDITENVRIHKLSISRGATLINATSTYMSTDCRVECSVYCCQVWSSRDGSTVAQGRG